MSTETPEKRLKVAIIGGGPGGLGAAIELAKLPYVDWNLYEKKPQISETGGGISLQRHTWRMLELNGVAGSINAKDFFRQPDGQSGQRRNGRTGVLLAKTSHPDDTPPHQISCRMVRAKLQAALLKHVDQSRVHVGRKLVGIEQLDGGKLRISFEDGLTDEVDLLVGADGIRSFIRKFSFPEHDIHYNGQSAYRTIISKSKVEEINGIPFAPVFWFHVNGLYVFTCPLGNDDFEVTARIRRPRDGQDQVSWGQPFDFHALLSEYDDFCLPIRQILRLAAEAGTQEFALFSGPRLERVVHGNNIALIGDASHPLSGAFGAGAGFALEDTYALSKSIDWAWARDKPLAEGLELFDSIRSPHYKGLYQVLDKFGASNAKILAEKLPVDEEIALRVQKMREDGDSWMYYYKVDEVVEEAIQAADKEQKATLDTAEPTRNEAQVDAGDKETEAVEAEAQADAEVQTQEKTQAEGQGKNPLTTQENGLGLGNDRESGLAAGIIGLAHPSEKVEAISVDIQKIPILAASN